MPSRHSRTDRYYDDDNDVDRAEPRQHDDAVCTTPGDQFSGAGVQILASEVATLRSAIDMVLERQQN